MANRAVWYSDPIKKEQGVDICVGDAVRIHYKLIEKEKVSGKTKREVHEEIHERTQPYEGLVIAISGSSENTMVTVRRIGAANVGIERIFPLQSPWIKKVDIKKHGKVRRAKLYYLRDRLGKNATVLHEAHANTPAVAR